MLNETEGDHFEHELQRKDETENLANLLQLLVILRFVVPVTVVSDGEHERVQENGQYNNRFEQVCMRQRHNNLTKPTFMVK